MYGRCETTSSRVAWTARHKWARQTRLAVARLRCRSIRTEMDLRSSSAKVVQRMRIRSGLAAPAKGGRHRHRSVRHGRLGREIYFHRFRVWNEAHHVKAADCRSSQRFPIIWPAPDNPLLRSYAKTGLRHKQHLQALHLVPKSRLSQSYRRHVLHGSNHSHSAYRWRHWPGSLGAVASRSQTVGSAEIRCGGHTSLKRQAGGGGAQEVRRRVPQAPENLAKAARVWQVSSERFTQTKSDS